MHHTVNQPLPLWLFSLCQSHYNHIKADVVTLWLSVTKSSVCSDISVFPMDLCVYRIRAALLLTRVGLIYGSSLGVLLGIRGCITL